MKWLTSNLIPAWNEQNWTAFGNATIDNEKMTLPPNSRIRLLLDSGGIVPGSSYMKLKYKFWGTFGDDFEYAPTSSIDIKIVYLDDTVQTFKVLLSMEKLVNDKYEDEAELEVEQKNIRSMEMFFNNFQTAPGNLYISSVELYKSEDINKEQVVDAVSESVAVRMVERYNNGCIIYWRGDVEPTKCEFISDDDGELLGILVDDEDFINTPRIYADL